MNNNFNSSDRFFKSNNITKNSKLVKLYNNSKLNINHNNTLIICDWDDTLFPTSWINENSIDINNININFMKYFNILDRYLYKTIKSIIKVGELLIITNASIDWIYTSLQILPLTHKLINEESISIISARDEYQNMTTIQNWKKYAFKAELQKRQNKHINIISIGDAHYEHYALVSLYSWPKIPHKYLKSVKFIKAADYEELFNQIEIIGNKINDIANASRHLDLTFDDN